MAPTSRFEVAGPAATTAGRNRYQGAISVPRLHWSVERAMRTVERGAARHERRVLTEPRFQRQASRASVPRAGDCVVPVDHNCSQTRNGMARIVPPLDALTSLRSWGWAAPNGAQISPPTPRTVGHSRRPPSAPSECPRPATQQQRRNGLAYSVGALLDIRRTTPTSTRDRTRHRLSRQLVQCNPGM